MDDRPHQYVVLMCLKKSDIAYNGNIKIRYFVRFLLVLLLEERSYQGVFLFSVVSIVGKQKRPSPRRKMDV